MPNIQSTPEAFGLTAFGDVEFSSGCYEFDTLIVWRNAAGQWCYAEDAGCSCPEPFVDVDLSTVTWATPHEIAARIQERLKEQASIYGEDPPPYGTDQAASLIECMMSVR